jgi:Na+-translocating ferredoxin:NAD+ oxidoreductase RnfD subunit
MISDPKTSPNAATGRVIFGALVAAVAYTIQFVLYEPNGPILALIVSAPLVPVIDAISRGQIYRWDHPVDDTTRPIKGVY